MGAAVKTFVTFNVNDYLRKDEETQRRYIEHDIVAKRENTANSLLGLQLLEGCGFHTGVPSNYALNYPSFQINDMKDFCKVHEALGGLREWNKNPVGDGRKREVEVTLCPKDKQFSHFRFTYTKVLPKGKKSKCRIKTIVEKRHVLVCE